MKYRYHTLNPAFDVMEFLPLMILQLSWACMSCEVVTLPEFQPNEYLFETHKNQGKERWEIFAWAVRDAMMSIGNFTECNQSVRTKIKYENFMQMKPNAENPALSISQAI